MAIEPLPTGSAELALPPLSDRYRRVRELTERLAAPLEAEDMVVQTIPEVSPTKWHLAHVTWFFERLVLAEHVPDYQPHDERYWYLFNSYYYSVGPMHLRSERGLLSRPTVNEVFTYRAMVDEAMLRLIEARGGEPELARLIELGLNHEQQHQELLLTDIKHVMSVNSLQPAYRADLPAVDAVDTPMRFVTGAEGVIEIGADGDSFHYDNEAPRHRVYLQPHALADRLVSNSEYREFIQDGGYTTCELWLSDGWAKVNEAGWDRPLYWSEDVASHFTLGGQRELDPHAAVSHLSYYEANAYARWAGARLPTEAEWEHAAQDIAVDGNLLDNDLLQTAGAPAEDAQGLRQIHGDAWEWTASAYAPYPGFQPVPGPLGEYNGKFMCNQMTVRGGSCLTSRDHLRVSYRSFFYPHDRWQELGLRLAKDG